VLFVGVFFGKFFQDSIGNASISHQLLSDRRLSRVNNDGVRANFIDRGRCDDGSDGSDDFVIGSGRRRRVGERSECVQTSDDKVVMVVGIVVLVFIGMLSNASHLFLTSRFNLCALLVNFNETIILLSFRFVMASECLLLAFDDAMRMSLQHVQRAHFQVCLGAIVFCINSSFTWQEFTITTELEQLRTV